MAAEHVLIKWHLWLIYDVTPAQGLQWYWNVLIGVSVALVLLLFLHLFLRHWHQSKGKISDELPQPQPPFAPLTVSLLQATASATPQDVTYAQLNHLALRQETNALPSSASEDPPDKPSVYAALAIH
ncbi:leukocyte immunoglobulin-like receptor subfamily B member 5 [Phyllostomus discolor]|uniref:Leukocyte immunoglobulin-like receptor subfamily B member 5 n=1 Tax=Phyllostomus discolor TaxID=89673 RepID=A0A7E6CTL5_9CHIR|nr:leukocyte immunoglobulin-like receptor subfamily B member 5 [Phyllostomus discolor]